ncbi:MAG: outer membrane protein assembly factor [Acidobacteriota bacterium]|nr:outer membrane protein assembly factor [Acidobacteriota bacterium]
MKALLRCFLFPGGAYLAASLAIPLLAGTQQPVGHLAASVNVNSRYLIEQVEIAGYPSAKIGASLRNRLITLPGTAYDTQVLEDLARDLRRDLHAKSVTQHVVRGSAPEMVKVVFDVERRSVALDLSVPKFLYHSKQGWSAQMLASTTVARNHNLVFGLVSDGDELTERFTGVQAAYENLHVGTDRVRFRMAYEDYHEQWNRATTAALSDPRLLSPNLRTASPEMYRSRRNFQPTFSVSVARPLVLSAGLSFERLDEQLPFSRVEGANAFVAALRYRKRVENEESGGRTVEASYGIRVGTRALGSDYIYARHHWTAGYTWSRGRHSVSDLMTAGYISGRAPLFERFVLGTSSLLRGWNRYDIDPLGGNRLLHNSVEYRYRFGNLFYDTGSLWSSGKVPSLKHSLGIGVRQSIFSLAVAFPVREGRIDPVFMVGMNY